MAITRLRLIVTPAPVRNSARHHLSVRLVAGHGCRWPGWPCRRRRAGRARWPDPALARRRLGAATARHRPLWVRRGGSRARVSPKCPRRNRTQGTS